MLAGEVANLTELRGGGITWHGVVWPVEGGEVGEGGGAVAGGVDGGDVDVVCYGLCVSMTSVCAGMDGEANVA